MSKQNTGFAIAALKAENDRLRRVILAVAHDMDGLSREQTVDISSLTFDYLMSVVKKIRDTPHS